MTDTLVRYDYNDFKKYQNINNIMPDELKEHCLHNNNNTISIRTEFESDIIEIINSIMKGVNPNNILTKNIIREYLNKLTKANIQDYLDKFDSINYTDDIMSTLINELIIRSMNDSISVKGFESDNEITLSEIYAEIIHYHCKKYNADPNNFGNLTRKICQAYFDDFINPSKPLDKNNNYRVDNFKGFMNFIGILFKKNIISSKIILICINSLYNLIISKNKTLDETHNIFMAYERIINQIIIGYNKKIIKDFSVLTNIKEIHDKMIANNNKNNFKKYGLITHEQITETINKLLAANL